LNPDETEAPPLRRSGWLFVSTILVGSFLLFLVQPMIARMALPRLGGAPAVWNSAMLVYQALLLGGYAYAHGIGRFSPRNQSLIHIALLIVAALWLPIGLIAMTPSATADPVLWVPWLLSLSIGPLFFAVAAQAPLMQRWYAIASGGKDPYALYAASNLGSFGGLIAYPLLVEPQMALHDQSWLWSGGYVLLAALVIACALRLPRGEVGREVQAPTSPRPDWKRVAYWIGCALVPSGLMLATTTFITTDIVAMPLLWVIPLGLYLLSFSVAFSPKRAVADTITTFAPLSILAFGGVVVSGSQERPLLSAGIAVLLLFIIAVALHTAMYRSRPEPERLTGFYLAMSIGGALGGVFAALIAPVVFDWTYEYPILILAAGALAPQRWLIDKIAILWRGTRRARMIRLAFFTLLVVDIVILGVLNPGGWLGDKHEGIAFVALAAIGFLAIGYRTAFVIVLAGALFLFGGYRALELSLDPDARVRSYFGVYTLRNVPSAGIRTLAHGTTYHGVQLYGTPARERRPTSYYVAQSGIGQAMLALPTLYGPAARVGVVGLGTGTLACYAQPGQDWRFYEIDPTVVDIAADGRLFTFLARCLPNAKVVMGDARIRIAEGGVGSLDLLALDAFSSDSVPMHLLTTEAFETYGRVLGRDGLLMVHISNRYLDLDPVVAAAARAGGWSTAKFEYQPAALEKSESLAAASSWIALSRSRAKLEALAAGDPDWKPLPASKDFTAWTDDYSTILPLVKALHPED
jgi:spermidine synthase